MRLTGISPAPTAIFALPPLLLSCLLSPFFFLNHGQALAEDSRQDHDHRHARSPNALGSYDVSEGLKAGYEHLVERYVPDFVGISRGIIGRAGDDTQTLENNKPGTPDSGIQGGESRYYTFPQATLLGAQSPSTPGLPSTLGRRDLEDADRGLLPDELRKTQSQALLYISLVTCSQPTGNGLAGQLSLYVSTSSSNQKPDQNNNNHAVTAKEGYGSLSLNASDAVFFTVSAPENAGFSGNYGYELTASIDDYYAMSHDQVYNQIVDTDTSSVYLYTNATTSSNSSDSVFQKWMSPTTAFTVYVQNQQNPSISGMESSWCALNKSAEVKLGPGSNDTSMTTAIDGQPKQQFHVRNLQNSNSYHAFMAIDGNSTDSGPGVVRGGGTVWARTNFTTKSDGNCAIIYNLSFCTDVGYAVPYNPNLTNLTSLGELYDNYSASLYPVFNKSLQQVPCNTTSSAQYSLARNCADCDSAYKQWLCAVTIPRCQDYSNSATYLQPRNLLGNWTNSTVKANHEGDKEFSLPHLQNKTYYNSSRNVWIDQNIFPGPYKEILPCKDVCYNLVQSCPALLQFACPLAGFGLNWTYGSPNKTLPPGEYSCNAMAVRLNGAPAPKVLGMLALVMATAATVVAMAV